MELTTIKGKLEPLELSLYEFMVGEGYDEDFHCFVDEFFENCSNRFVCIDNMIYEIIIESTVDREVDKVYYPITKGDDINFEIINYTGQRSLGTILK